MCGPRLVIVRIIVGIALDWELSRSNLVSHPTCLCLYLCLCLCFPTSFSCKRHRLPHVRPFAFLLRVRVFLFGVRVEYTCRRACKWRKSMRDT